MQANPSTIRLDLRIGKCAVDRLSTQARDVGIPLREHIHRIVQKAAERSIQRTDEESHPTVAMKLNLVIELDGPVLEYYREQFRQDTAEQDGTEPGNFDDYLAYTALLLLNSLYESDTVQ